MATVQDSTFARTADVNTDSELTVALSKVLTKAGYAIALGENHDGSSGLAALRRSTYISPEKRLGVGLESPIWNDLFNHTVLDTDSYNNNSTTSTVALASGFMTLNSGASTASGAASSVRSYRSFPIFGNYPTTLDFWFSLTLVPQAQNNIEIGLGIPNATNTSSPTDGTYMLIDTAGALQLVCNYNGASTTSGAITLPASLTWTAAKVYHGEIVTHADRAELYFDRIYIGQVLRSSASSVGSMSQNQAGNLFCRLHNAAATAGAQKLNISQMAVTLGDGNFNRAWGAVRTGMSDDLSSPPRGVAVGQLDNIANSAAPSSATLSNTAAGYTTPGGNFQFAAVAGAETDFALFAYQVPALAPGVSGKNLVVTGIFIDTKTTGAAGAATLTNLDWYVGTGATAVSLATADAATTRAPKRKYLGGQSFGATAPIGAQADRSVSADFSSAPLLVEPGCFFHIILRMPIGTATGSQIFRGGVRVLGYFE